MNETAKMNTSAPAFEMTAGTPAGNLSKRAPMRTLPEQAGDLPSEVVGGLLGLRGVCHLRGELRDLRVLGPELRLVVL